MTASFPRRGLDATARDRLSLPPLSSAPERDGDRDEHGADGSHCQAQASGGRPLNRSSDTPPKNDIATAIAFDVRSARAGSENTRKGMIAQYVATPLAGDCPTSTLSLRDS
jgi:hypothetical protein